jgi:hypothetical protein
MLMQTQAQCDKYVDCRGKAGNGIAGRGSGAGDAKFCATRKVIAVEKGMAGRGSGARDGKLCGTRKRGFLREREWQAGAGAVGQGMESGD